MQRTRWLLRDRACKAPRGALAPPSTIQPHRRYQKSAHLPLPLPLAERTLIILTLGDIVVRDGGTSAVAMLLSSCCRHTTIPREPHTQAPWPTRAFAR